MSCGPVPMVDEYKYCRFQVHITHLYSLQVFCLITTFITSYHSHHSHLPCALPPSLLLSLAGRYFLNCLLLMLLQFRLKLTRLVKGAAYLMGAELLQSHQTLTLRPNLRWKTWLMC
ncbi:hypothetical protein F5888DRAFT_1903599 [Russula emetica]|nr:hypothetical protein F5888DRAFT_1903599 [Russula emetica]